MLNDLTIRKAVELELDSHGPAHDYTDAQHSAGDDAAFDHALHKKTPFETVERRLAEELKHRKR